MSHFSRKKKRVKMNNIVGIICIDFSQMHMISIPLVTSSFGINVPSCVWDSSEFMLHDTMYPPKCLRNLSYHPRPTNGCLVGITILSKTFVPFGKLATIATYFPISSASTNPSSLSRRAASSGDMMELRTFPGLI